MSLICWKESYLLNIPEIDSQHMMIVDLVNGLYGAIQGRKNSSTIEGIADNLIDQIERHFFTEERCFCEAGFLYAEDHIREHQQFREKVSSVSRDIQRGETTLSLELMRFLANWFKAHLREADQRYARHLKES